jgi:hypothetical protein
MGYEDLTDFTCFRSVCFQKLGLRSLRTIHHFHPKVNLIAERFIRNKSQNASDDIRREVDVLQLVDSRFKVREEQLLPRVGPPPEQVPFLKYER